jgi:exosortase A
MNANVAGLGVTRGTPPVFDRGWLLVPPAIAALVAVLWPSFDSMLAQWANSTFNYCYLVVPISLYLAWRNRDRLVGLPLEPTALPLLLALPALAVWCAAIIVRVDMVHHAAAVAVLVLLIWSLVGHRIARAIAFPLGYLFLMVPCGDFLIPPLMHLTADVAAGAVMLTGIPVYQDGFVFSLPSGDFEVIEGCSGVRFLLTTIAAGLAFAYLAYESLAKRLVFLTLCVIMPIVGNLIRAYGVVMIVHLTNGRFGAGNDHVLYGTIFYAAILVGFFIVAARYSDPLPATSARPVSPPPRRSRPWLAFWPAPVALLLAAGVAAAPGVIQRSSPMAGGSVASVPGSVAGWSGPAAAPTDWQPRFATAVGTELATFSGLASGRPRNGVVEVFAASYALVGAQADLTSSANGFDKPPEWRIVRNGVTSSGGIPRRETLIRGANGRSRLVWWWFRVGDTWTTSAIEAEWLTLRSALAGGAPVREVVALSGPFEGAAAEPAAREALAAFSRAAGLPVMPDR